MFGGTDSDTVHIRYINHELRQILQVIDINLNSAINQITNPNDLDVDVMAIRDKLVETTGTIKKAGDILNNLTIMANLRDTLITPLSLIKKDILIVESLKRNIDKLTEKLEAKHMNLTMTSPPVLILGMINTSQMLNNTDLLFANSSDFDNIIRNIISFVIEISDDGETIDVVPSFKPNDELISTICHENSIPTTNSIFNQFNKFIGVTSSKTCSNNMEISTPRLLDVDQLSQVGTLIIEVVIGRAGFKLEVHKQMFEFHPELLSDGKLLTSLNFSLYL